MIDTSTVNDMMKSRSEEAVSLGLTFARILDFSEASLKNVDEILESIYRTIPRDRLSRIFEYMPSDEQIWQMSTMWGAYIGEVIRKKYGGEWSLRIATDTGTIVRLKVSGSDSLPCEKVYDQLINGGENSIWDYYHSIAHPFNMATNPGGLY